MRARGRRLRGGRLARRASSSTRSRPRPAPGVSTDIRTSRWADRSSPGLWVPESRSCAVRTPRDQPKPPRPSVVWHDRGQPSRGSASVSGPVTHPTVAVPVAVLRAGTSLPGTRHRAGGEARLLGRRAGATTSSTSQRPPSESPHRRQRPRCRQEAASNVMCRLAVRVMPDPERAATAQIGVVRSGIDPALGRAHNAARMGAVMGGCRWGVCWSVGGRRVVRRGRGYRRHGSTIVGVGGRVGRAARSWVPCTPRGGCRRRRAAGSPI